MSIGMPPIPFRNFGPLFSGLDINSGGNLKLSNAEILLKGLAKHGTVAVSSHER